MPHSSESDVFNQQTDFSTLFYSLIERSLASFERGSFTEGSELLDQIRAQLPADLVSLETVLDRLRETATHYQRAEQMLREASKHFTDIDQEWQSRLDAVRRELFSASIHQSVRQRTPLIPVPAVSPIQVSPDPCETTDSSGVSTTDQLPPLYVTCFGRFTVRRFGVNGPVVTLCRSVKGQMLLRYLLTRPNYQATIDSLMADLWPEEERETARHKLQVALSALRRSLNSTFVQGSGHGYVLYQDRSYQLNPALEWQTDIARFLALYQAGHKSDDRLMMIAFYEQACQLWTAPFLSEDLYAEWSFALREQLTRIYLLMCSSLAEQYQAAGEYEAAITWANASLKIDNCDEEAYRHLMRAYASSGKRSEAIRQYQQCRQALAEELDVQPMNETQQLLQEIMHDQMSIEE